MKYEILKMYFEEKMKQIDIANKLGISKYKVSRILNKDIRYLREKENRKQINKRKNKEYTKKYITSKRKKKSSDDYIILKQAHEQASKELSGGRKPISNRAFRDWNPSIYDYNSKSQSYILKRGLVVGNDVPHKIKWNL